MRIGINTTLFACPFHNQDAKYFPEFRRWGYDTVELAICAPSDLSSVYVRDQLDKHGLVVGSICGIFGPGRDLRGSPAEQEASIKYIKDLIRQMQILGCSVLAGPMYSSVGRAERETEEAKLQQWKLVKQHLRELSAYAGDHGCTLCIEPINRFETDFLNTCEQAVNLVSDVDHPALKIHLDTFHMNIEEKDLGLAIRRANSLLGHIHASGSDRGTPGNDHTDWRILSSALRFVKYQGDVVVESYPSDVKFSPLRRAIWRRIEPTREQIARKGAQFLRRVLNPYVGWELAYCNRSNPHLPSRTVSARSHRGAVHRVTPAFI